MAEFQEQQEQRSLHGPHLCHQGSRWPPCHGGTADLREAAARVGTGPVPLRTRHAGYAGALLRAEPLREHETANLYSQMRGYDGESLREVDPRAKSMQEYKDAAGVAAGMVGVQTRFGSKR